MNKITTLIIITILISGCMSAKKHKADVQDDSTDRVTVGVVQKEIRVGMSGSEVAQVLGSPNIVSTDEKRREVWIYDKISTTSAYSNSNGGVSTLFLGGASNFGGGIGAGFGQGAGAHSRIQKTLTIIIKFSKDKIVRDFAYHTSRF